MIRAAPYFAEVAALMGDPGRANILAALMDGRPKSAKELALVAGVSAPTASEHLAKLVAGRLIDASADGRHRFFRLADPLVASAVESMMALAQEGPKRHRPASPAELQLRLARTCYDHLAGQLGVALTGHLVDAGHLAQAGTAYRVTSQGERLMTRFGIDLAAVRRQRRNFAPACLDWSERKPHLAGALGAALAGRCFELGFVARRRGTRAIRITPLGEREFRRRFGIDLEDACAQVSTVKPCDQA
jgi:DNA-binding transcriptional ArsR family regulator